VAKTKSTVTPKKRNPQDTTLRNNRATDKRLDTLEAAVRALRVRVQALESKDSEDAY
jgi:hypothetical protein